VQLKLLKPKDYNDIIVDFPIGPFRRNLQTYSCVYEHLQSQQCSYYSDGGFYIKPCEGSYYSVCQLDYSSHKNTTCEAAENEDPSIDVGQKFNKNSECNTTQIQDAKKVSAKALQSQTTAKIAKAVTTGATAKTRTGSTYRIRPVRVHN
jgi:hypothetical protein